MRRVLRRLIAVAALIVGAGVATSAPAHASTTQSCKAVKGTLNVAPALTNLAKDHLMFGQVRLTRCTNAGGAGRLSLNVRLTQATCGRGSSYLAPTPVTISWLDGTTSVLNLSALATPGEPAKIRLEGSVNSGQFLGAKIDAGIRFQAKLSSSRGSCSTASPIHRVSVANYKSFTFQPPADNTTLLNLAFRPAPATTKLVPRAQPQSQSNATTSTTAADVENIHTGLPVAQIGGIASAGPIGSEPHSGNALVAGLLAGGVLGAAATVGGGTVRGVRRRRIENLARREVPTHLGVTLPPRR